MVNDVNWFEGRVKLTPKETAIVDAKTNKSWTYEQLHERVMKLTAIFHAKGVKKGDRVGLLSPNDISYFDFFFACMKIGAIFVPFNWRLATSELNYCLNDSAPILVGASPNFAAKLAVCDHQVNTLIIEHDDYLEKEIISGFIDTETKMEEIDPLAMIYTGGTTGRPKGVILSHRSILWNALNTITSWGLTKDDVTLTCLPMFHTGGLNVLSLPLLLVGGKVVLRSDFDPEQVMSDINKHQCTVVMLVPTMYHMIIESETFRTTEFPSMKLFVSGGAPCPLRVYQAFLDKGIVFKEGYGLTEAGPNNFYIDPSDVMNKMGSVGKPMLFNEIKIVAEDSLHAGPDEVGELYVRGNHAFMYYWNRPEETEETLVDGWVRTGDLARQDADGYVYIVGRKKDMIITGGENVYPLEIEHWLESHPDISEAAVVGMPDEKWGEAVTAFIVSESKLTPEELEAYCNEQLTRYKVPKQFIFIEELPKTDVGKVNKNLLKESYSKPNKSLL